MDVDVSNPEMQAILRSVLRRKNSVKRTGTSGGAAPKKSPDAAAVEAARRTKTKEALAKATTALTQARQAEVRLKNQHEKDLQYVRRNQESFQQLVDALTAMLL